VGEERGDGVRPGMYYIRGRGALNGKEDKWEKVEGVTEKYGL